MSKSTAQLRKELAAAIAEHDRYLASPTGALVGSVRRLEDIRNASRALLDALDTQPSRAGKPYRVTFVHQRGTLEGRTFRESKGNISEAVHVLRTVISVGAKASLSIRADDGEYKPADLTWLLSHGYDDIAYSDQYMDTPDGLED